MTDKGPTGLLLLCPMKRSLISCLPVLTYCWVPGPVLVLTSRTEEKQVRELVEHSRQLRTHPWISRRVMLTMCALGTFLVNLTENRLHGAPRLCLFLRANFDKNYFVERMEDTRPPQRSPCKGSLPKKAKAI